MVHPLHSKLAFKASIMLPIVVTLLLPPKRGCPHGTNSEVWPVENLSYASTTRILCDSLMLQLSSWQIPSL